MADAKKPKKDKAAEIPADAKTPEAATSKPGAVGKEVDEVKKPARKPAAKGGKTTTAKAKDTAKAADKPAAKKPAAKKPAAKAKADDKPAAKAKADKPDAKAKADKPAAKAKADEKPVAKAKAEKKPAAKAKADEKPAAKAKADEKPVAKADEKPAAKADKPAARPAARRRGGRAGDPAVLVRAHAKYVRSSARKARLVCDAIRGKDVEEARAILAFHPRAVAEAWEKLLGSAIANAENNHDLDGSDLKVHAVFADEGPTIKRFRPRAMGRATQIRKRTSHLTIQLAPKETR